MDGVEETFEFGSVFGGVEVDDVGELCCGNVWWEVAVKSSVELNAELVECEGVESVVDLVLGAGA